MDKYSENIIERASKIKVLVLDVDGVLTDGGIVYDRFGGERKHFDISDGLGMMLVKRAGLKCVILTAKASKAVTRRAKDLKVDKVYQNFHYKIEALELIRRRYDIKDEEICFVGDDLIDIPVLKRVGLAVTPVNAREEVKSFSHLVTVKEGGRGAVREVCDLLLRSQGKWEDVTKRYFND